MRRRRQLGSDCSTSSRTTRGIVGGLAGGLAGAVIGLLAGAAVGAKKIADASSQTAPLKSAIMTVLGVTAVGVAVGATASAIPSEC